MINCFWILVVISSFITTFAYSDSAQDQPYVSAKIYGQMGNNLFQVAAASALAWDNGAAAYFPSLKPSSDLFKHVLFRCKRNPPNPHISAYWHEPSGAFVYIPIPYKPNIEIDGYFQSEKYFAHYRDKILELFAPLESDLEYINKKYAWLINNPNTVGVQIRYYAGWWHAYPQCGMKYFSKAMSLFPESSIFVVSSDNIAFAKQNIPSWAKNVVFLENEPNYIDFYLLSLCQHNIISNSSFGWWSAWLNKNANKKVVAPSFWIYNLPYPDIYPEGWTVLDAPAHPVG